jgi:hypothetical protein
VRDKDTRRRKKVVTMTITAVHNIGDVLRPIITPIPVPTVPEDFMPLPGPAPANDGVVPPWLEVMGDDDPGWGLELYDPTNPGLNPVDPDTPVIMNDGVVPPWLR